MGQAYELLQMPAYALYYFRRAATIQYVFVCDPTPPMVLTTLCADLTSHECG